MYDTIMLGIGRALGIGVIVLPMLIAAVLMCFSIYELVHHRRAA